MSRDNVASRQRRRARPRRAITRHSCAMQSRRAPDIVERFPATAAPRPRSSWRSQPTATRPRHATLAAAAAGARAGGRARRPGRRTVARTGHGAAVRFRRLRRSTRPSPRRSPSDVPEAEPRRLRRHRDGQAGQPRAQLFLRRRPDPAVRSGDAAAARARGAGEAAVRIGRRLIEIAPEAHRGRLCPARRPAAAAVARSHADRAAGRCRDLALRIERAAVGARRLHPRPRRRRRSRARAAISRRDPAVRLAALARFRRDRRDPADLGADPRPFRARARHRPRLRPQARPRRHPRGRVLRPDPPADPRRPRSLGARAGDARRARGAARGRADRRPSGAASLPTPIACSARSSTGCRWSTTRRPICCRPTRQRSTMSRSSTACATARRCSTLLRPHVERPARSSTASRRTSGVSCRTTGHLEEELAELGFADPASAARHVADWRSGKARSLRSPAAQQAFEAMLPALMQALAAGARPRSRAQPLERHRRAAVERGQLFRLLEARPPLAQLLASPHPCAGACRPARRGGRSCSTA